MRSKQVRSGESERRKHRRVPFDRPCWCEGDDVTLYVRFANASEGGSFLRTAISLDIGRRARLAWYSPEIQDEVVAEVEVVWRSSDRPNEPGPRGMGLRFLSFEKNGDRFLDILRRGGGDKDAAS
ncbi:MAG: PilZ domain-containing protein [Deltaproteobacteria bacterium]|nr:PilZ domain-containing protein [Deltaproteobacteria bacterium]